MNEDRLAILRTHRSNVHRYRRLLATELTELERNFVERRLKEEREAIAMMTSDPILLGPRPSQAPGIVPDKTGGYDAFSRNALQNTSVDPVEYGHTL